MRENKSTNKILVAVPCFNALEYTKKLLNTVRLFENQALLLIDNGSTDGTTEFIQDYKSDFNLFRIKLKGNAGVASAWNVALKLGFEYEKSDAVILLNNDILLNPFTIKRIAEDLNLPDVGLASACDISKKCADENEFLEQVGILQRDYKEEPQFSCFGMNKKCYMKVGPFDEAFYPAYFEDNDYHYRMRLDKLKAVCNTGNFYFHYGSRTKLVNEHFQDYLGYRYLENEKYYQKKWGGKPGEEKYTIPFDGKPPEKISIVEFEQYQADPDKYLNN